MKYLAMSFAVPRSATWPIALKLTAASVLALSLAACATAYHDTRTVGIQEPTTVEERHPILVAKEPTEIKLAVAPGSSGLSEFQVVQVEEFIGNWRHEGAGKLTISAPSGSANEHAAYEIAGEIRKLARGADVPAHAIAVEPYYADGNKPPVKLSFLKYVARGPRCGDWSENLAEDPRNVAYPNFGCAQQHNLAAMIANPRDLIEPRDMWQRPSERRDEQWRKWVIGDSTIAERAAEEKAGNISDVAKQ